MARRTKIIATIGPTSEHPDVIRSMILAGMDVARIGLAHGTVGQAIEKMQTIRRVAEELGRNIGVMADLPGPKVRLGAAPEGGLLLTDGMVVRIQVGEEGSTTEVLTVDYPRLLEDVRVGDTLAVGDGFPTITITGQKGDSLIGTVHGEALINGRKGLHIPSDRLTMATPTAEDLLYLDALVDAEVDMVALSFIRSAHDVRRAGVEPHPRGPLIVAKIETRAAVENLAGIIESCGAIMVARGDLGIECGIEELPHIQKMIIRECIASGRPVITATQMLESMIQSSSPTRAEVTDVANAIFDGTSGVMLSAETAVGVDPTNAVATMGRIAARADQAFDYDRWPRTMRDLTSVQRDTGARVTDAIHHAYGCLMLDVASGHRIGLLRHHLPVGFRFHRASYRSFSPVDAHHRAFDIAAHRATTEPVVGRRRNGRSVGTGPQRQRAQPRNLGEGQRRREVRRSRCRKLGIRGGRPSDRLSAADPSSVVHHGIRV